MAVIDFFEYAPGATPLDPDEIDGLLPGHITLQSQLNEWEQENILQAERWIGSHKFTLEKVMNVEFIQKLHQRMFNKTWGWAGSFRKSNKNIGVDWLIIPVELRTLIEDSKYQIENKSFNFDEIATRFHHRLVAIHLFANGNGRHARLMTDILLLSMNKERFSWGQQQKLVDVSPIREKYISSLRAADKMNYQPLLEFVRS